MGVAVVRETEKGHHTRLPGRLRSQYNWEKTGGMRAVQPRPEGKDETNRLPETG